MYDAFGIDRSDISKGFSPEQLEIMHNAGGDFAHRAMAAKTGKGRDVARRDRDKVWGQIHRESSLDEFPRGTQNKARSTGYRKEYVAPKQSPRGAAFAQARANGQRVVLGRDSDAAWKLNSAKANGAKFGANNPANRVKPSSKRSMASVKSRVRAKFGNTSY